MWMLRTLQYLALLMDQIFSLNTGRKNLISECTYLVEMMSLLQKALKFLWNNTFDNLVKKRTHPFCLI